ncbi:hypothetical protein KUTeg_004250 [Tegillarca granosa]|uniref:Cytochrome b-c1 complex subunit 2, mitochondrial n=1 Tax=Tegillarca granosa TaxID=220873 RepID=A0ABQ9FPE9_TEGGR|nr:hypothetical protein KUTeg_004250 [Tegillarca granosa]
MTSVASRVIARSLRGNRFYGTQAAVKQAESLVASRKLPNGLTVVSVNENSPVKKVAVAVNAGARYEKIDELGVTHALRRGANLGTSSFSTIEITKNIQVIGGNFSCTSTRELMLYCFTGVNSVMLDKVISLMGSITTEPLFNFWELAELKKQMTTDLAFLENNPNAKLVELLHNAAYRGTLGRSLYASEHRLEKLSQEQLLGYVGNNYVRDRMALIGVGVELEQLESLGSTWEIGSPSSSDNEKVVYCGGERLHDTGGDMAYVAVANEGVGSTSKEFLTSIVLQMIMGTEPSIKYAGCTSRLGQAVSQGTNKPFSVSCLNMNYSDSGLFGFHIQGYAGDIDKMVKKASEQFASLTKGGLTDQEVARAKNKTKAAIAMKAESSESIVSDLAEQVFTHGQFFDLADINRAVDAIQTADVVNLAKKIVNGTSSLAATGNCQNVPHLPELFK